MKNQTEKRWLWAGLAAGAVALCVLLAVSWHSGQQEMSAPSAAAKPIGQTSASGASVQTTSPSQSQPSTPAESTAETLQSTVDTTAPVVQTSALAEYGLEITSIGSYTGIYMEDGTDELVTGVAMLVLANRGEETIQYADLSLSDGVQELNFTLSTLPPDTSVVLLEQDREEYVEGTQYEVRLHSVALFDTPLTLQEEFLEFQTLDGAVNITNISGQDITEDIVLYYKNWTQGLLYGGITYRIRLEGGLSAGEVRQVMAKHFADSSKIMFVTIG